MQLLPGFVLNTINCCLLSWRAVIMKEGQPAALAEAVQALAQPVLPVEVLAQTVLVLLPTLPNSNVQTEQKSASLMASLSLVSC